MFVRRRSVSASRLRRSRPPVWQAIIVEVMIGAGLLWHYLT